MSTSVNRCKWNAWCNVKPLVIRAMLTWSNNVVTDTMAPLGKISLSALRQTARMARRFSSGTPFSLPSNFSSLKFWSEFKLCQLKSELAGAKKRLAAPIWFGGSYLEWGKSLVKDKREGWQKKCRGKTWKVLCHRVTVKQKKWQWFFPCSKYQTEKLCTNWTKPVIHSCLVIGPNCCLVYNSLSDRFWVLKRDLARPETRVLFFLNGLAFP